MSNILNYSVIPSRIKYVCCAQFYVHRDIILANSRQTYVDLLNWLLDQKAISSVWFSKIFEWTWHIIFTRNLTDATSESDILWRNSMQYFSNWKDAPRHIPVEDERFLYRSLLLQWSPCKPCSLESAATISSIVVAVVVVLVEVILVALVVVVVVVVVLVVVVKCNSRTTTLYLLFLVKSVNHPQLKISDFRNLFPGGRRVSKPAWLSGSSKILVCSSACGASPSLKNNLYRIFLCMANPT